MHTRLCEPLVLVVLIYAVATAAVSSSSPFLIISTCSQPQAPANASATVPCFSSCAASASLSPAVVVSNAAAFYDASSACALQSAAHGFEAFSNAQASPASTNSTLADAYVSADCLVSTDAGELASGFYTECVDTPAVFFDFMTRGERGAAYRVSVVSDASQSCEFAYGANDTGGVSLTLYESCALNAQPLYCARSALNAAPANAFSQPLVDMYVPAGDLQPYTLYRLRLRVVDDDDCGCFTVCVAALVPPNNARCESATPMYEVAQLDVYSAATSTLHARDAVYVLASRKAPLETAPPPPIFSVHLVSSVLFSCSSRAYETTTQSLASTFAGHLQTFARATDATCVTSVGGVDVTFSEATRVCFADIVYAVNASTSASLYNVANYAFFQVQEEGSALRTTFLFTFSFPHSDSWALQLPGGGSVPVPPTPQPTVDPNAPKTPSPTAPTAMPTLHPTPLPTQPLPTNVPTLHPTPLPTQESVTPSPSNFPTPLPTAQPTPLPTALPTAQPTALPTGFPTPLPTGFPTPLPTGFPTPLPTSFPTPLPTSFPTSFPTPMPATPTPPPPTKGGGASVTPAPTPLPTPPPPPTTTSSKGNTPAPTRSPTAYDATCAQAQLEAAFPCCDAHAEIGCYVASCCVNVCLLRAECCVNAWDSTCALYASTVCGDICGANAPPTPLFTARPTPLPTAFPTPLPTPQPTPLPTAFPTPMPSNVPTVFPTPAPSAFPTPLPTPLPTVFPTPAPTMQPGTTASPTLWPTLQPTPQPTPPPPTPQPTPLPTPPPPPTATCPLIGTCTSATGDAFGVCIAAGNGATCPSGSVLDANVAFGSGCVPSDPSQASCACCGRSCNTDYGASPCSTANPTQDTVCVPRGTCASHFNGALLSATSCSASLSAAAASCECCSLTGTTQPAPPPDTAYSSTACFSAFEVCRGTQLYGATCTSLGFAGGTLACKSTCDAFVVSGCTPYGTCCMGASTCIEDVTSCAGGVFVPHATTCTPALCAAVYSGASPFQRARQASAPFEAGGMVSTTNAYVYTGQTSCNAGCYIGTFGAVVVNDSTVYALSNAHVIASPAGASSSTYVAGGCSVRSPPNVGSTRVYQSSGCANDASGTWMATLSAHTQLTPNSWQRADAAGAALRVAATDVHMALGAVGSATPLAPALGALVVKSSATTSVAVGQIIGINANVRVWYNTDDAVSDGAYPVLFVDQVIATGIAPTADFSLGGDSGGVILDYMTRRAVSLNFAGSAGISISTPMTTVLAELFGASSGAAMYQAPLAKRRHGGNGSHASSDALWNGNNNNNDGQPRHVPTHVALDDVQLTQLRQSSERVAEVSLDTRSVRDVVARVTGDDDYFVAYYVAYQPRNRTAACMVVGIDSKRTPNLTTTVGELSRALRDEHTRHRRRNLKRMTDEEAAADYYVRPLGRIEVPRPHVV